jgi:hypothetical protein
MRHFITLTALVCATLLSSSPALAQFSQQGAKLVGTGAVGTGRDGVVFQGQAVALSADGNTAIVGGWDDDGGAGAVWIWTRSGGVWTQQSGKLVGSGAEGVANQGQSVALSADGNTAIVGGWLDNRAQGAAWVWTRTGGVWTQQGPKLYGSGAVYYPYQGSSVSLSADGNTAMVGGLGDNNNAGAVWVWTRSGGLWTQQSGKLVGSGAIGSAAQGETVSLSADGNTAIIGGPDDNRNSLGYGGAAWVWTRSGGVWTQQSPKLVGSGAEGFASQGLSVSLSGDGNTAIVGGPWDAHVFASPDGFDGSVGAAWIWTRSGGVWTQQSKLVGWGAARIASQGASVSLSADGNTAIIGGYNDVPDGAAWVWTRNGEVWSQQSTKLVGSGGVRFPGQGSSVSLSADGKTAIVGGPADNNSVGAVWIFAVDESVVPRRRAIKH